MHFLISGASGMIGSELVSRLTARGHAITRLTRGDSSPDFYQIHWNPELEVAPVLPGVPFDAVIHLAGENVGARRWDKWKKAHIRDSRVSGARILCDAISRMKPPPRVFVSASAVGYYGDRGDEMLDEESGPGAGFLAGVCRDLEAEVAFAGQQGIRSVSLRFGVVLSDKGGALAAMLRPFRLGLGGVMGSGRQYMSWITLDDAVRALEHCLETETLHGPVVAATPRPVTNREFAKTLGKVLNRPALLPAPSFALQLAFGEMAREMLLSSQRVKPGKLLATGFSFHQPELEPALRALLCR
ncbi:MAG: TIGR01777 family oxidoreductase [Acidobacteriota bacterium]|nr:TIGR01777 family oxidoreductase [Acidobacteriota bacterium]